METPGRYLYLPPAGDDPVIAPWPADAERTSRAMTLLKLIAELARDLLVASLPADSGMIESRASDADALADALRAYDAVSDAAPAAQTRYMPRRSKSMPGLSGEVRQLARRLK